VLHEGTYANLENAEEVFDIGLNRAVAMLADKRAGGGRPQRGQRRRWLKSAITLKTVSRSACCRDALVPTSSTATPTPTCRRASRSGRHHLDEAVALIAERVAKGGGKKPAKKAAAKKAAGQGGRRRSADGAAREEGSREEAGGEEGRSQEGQAAKKRRQGDEA
jgi:DNA topoisomerase-1